ncbi:MAG: 5'/3'-nucleotidase SurE [Candidatus Marinimicrobia bacterium]|nr:5'/3'-nucleotidase SurE [Candidatus Neomarinimicrobiota bacterium]
MSTNKKPNILLVNDDGIAAPGLLALYNSLKDVADITIVAPDGEQSATGHSITLDSMLSVSEHYYNDKFFGIALKGTPADCVKFAISEIYKKPPDMVISGINLGSNTGYNVHYSGTVSAGAEGALMGIPSVAISITTYVDANFKPAGQFIKSAINKIYSKGLPLGTMLNVNVPNVKNSSEIKGIKITEQGQTRWKEIFYKRKDPKNRTYYWMTGEKMIFKESDLKDESAVNDNYISITPIQLDMTDYKNIETIKNLNLTKK